MKPPQRIVLLASFVTLSCASGPTPHHAPRVENSAALPAPQPAAPSQSQPASQAGATRADADALYARKEWSAALEIYRTELARSSNDAALLDRVAHCEHLQGRFEQSLAAWEELARLRPRDPVAAYNVACANARLGRVDAGFAALERALASGFRDIAMLTSDSDLESLRSTPAWAPLIERAREAKPGAAKPPAELEQFAFWVGEWDVFSANGGRAGSSRVERILGGWVLLENWSGADGMQGKSFNSYDVARGCWRQHWVDDRGQALDFHNGKLENGALTFHASWKDASGAVIRRRMSFTDLGEKGVRQYSERSSDEGQSWQQEYELFYRRRAGG